MYVYFPLPSREPMLTDHTPCSPPSPSDRCYSVSDVPWYQKKIAAVVFATPPYSTFKEVSPAHPNVSSLLSIGCSLHELGPLTSRVCVCIPFHLTCRANVFLFKKKTHFPFQLFVNSILKDNYIRNSVSENLRLQLTPLTP